MIEARILKENFASLLHHRSGSLESKAHVVNEPDQANSESLTFVSTPEQLQKALSCQPAILVALESIDLKSIPHTQTLFTCRSIQIALASLLPFFSRTNETWNQSSQISPLAFIHPEARLGANVIIQPYAYIGAHAILGQGVRVGANSVIQNHAVIGQNTILHPFVFIAAQSEIGVDCEIHPHTTIGAEGFGFWSETKLKHHKIPQVGRVIIGDRVRIGSNCAIDRATMGATWVDSDTKIDNHCHVAHNCKIGQGSLMAAGFMMAGSSQAGKGFISGGSAVVTDHVTITDHVVIAGRSAVTNDIKESGAYGGYPLQSLRESLKTLAAQTHLVQMKKQIAKILKHLHLDKENAL